MVRRGIPGPDNIPSAVVANPGHFHPGFISCRATGQQWQQVFSAAPVLVILAENVEEGKLTWPEISNLQTSSKELPRNGK